MSQNEITIERVEELRLSQEQETQIAQLLKATYSVDFQDRSFFQNRHHCRFMAYQNGEVVGHLAVAYRAIQMGDRTVNIIGIGEVAVAKKARKQGVATELVQCALDEGRLARADFATLFGTEALYAKAGFAKATNVITLSEMEGARTGAIVHETDHYFMIKPLSNMAWDIEAPVDLAGFAF